MLRKALYVIIRSERSRSHPTFCSVEWLNIDPSPNTTACVVIRLPSCLCIGQLLLGSQQNEVVMWLIAELTRCSDTRMSFLRGSYFLQVSAIALDKYRLFRQQQYPLWRIHHDLSSRQYSGEFKLACRWKYAPCYLLQYQVSGRL